MDLFIQPVQDFEKVAAEVDLPEDPNAWPKEILDELYKQVPYVADFHPHVVMSKVDAERGYGFGYVEIANKSESQMDADPAMVAAAGIRSVRIPVVIKDGRLSPFDILVNDASKILPLTESRLRQSIFRPQAFDVTSQTPGDQSMVGQLYPPYRQNYGFGGGGMTVPADAGMGKTGSAFEEFLITELEKQDAGFRRPGQKTAAMAKCSGCGGSMPCSKCGTAKTASRHVTFRKTASLLKEVLPTINQSDLDAFWGSVQKDFGLQAQFRKNAEATMGALGLLANHQPVSSEKTAAALLNAIHPTVVQISSDLGGYRVKTASHEYWAPLEERVSRGDLVRRFGEKVAFAVDSSGAVTIADNARAVGHEKVSAAGPVQRPGIYKVQDSEGNELVGYVIPNLIDTDGQPLPVSLFTNGSQATVQDEVIGEPAGDGANLPTGPIQGFGAFFHVAQDGELHSTVPMTIDASHTMENEPETFVGETYDGRPVEVSVQPNIQEIVGMEEGKMLIPQDWKWMDLSKAKEVSLSDGEPPAVPNEAEEKEVQAHVEVRASGESFSFRGPAVAKLAAAEKEFVDIDGAMFLLAGLGVDQGYGTTKLAHALTGERPERIKIGRLIKTAAEQRAESFAWARQLMSELPDLRRSLIKEAADIPDPTAVDTVLSLGFINPENIMTFVSYLPTLDDCQMKLCDLLLAARTGLQDVSPGAIERAVRATEEVIEGLKTIAFQES